MKRHTGQWIGLTIHHTDGHTTDTVESVKKLHKEKNGWGDIGYHYMLEIKDGKGYLKKGRSTGYWGAHAGVDYYNSNYLGLSVAGDYHKNKMPEQIYEDLISAICTLVKKFKLTHLNGHRECKATDCPGKNIDLNKLRTDVNKKLKASGYNVTLVK